MTKDGLCKSKYPTFISFIETNDDGYGKSTPHIHMLIELPEKPDKILNKLTEFYLLYIPKASIKSGKIEDTFDFAFKILTYFEGKRRGMYGKSDVSVLLKNKLHRYFGADSHTYIDSFRSIYYNISNELNHLHAKNESLQKKKSCNSCQFTNANQQELNQCRTDIKHAKRKLSSATGMLKRKLKKYIQSNNKKVPIDISALRLWQYNSKEDFLFFTTDELFKFELPEPIKETIDSHLRNIHRADHDIKQGINIDMSKIRLKQNQKLLQPASGKPDIGNVHRRLRDYEMKQKQHKKILMYCLI